MTPIWAIVPFAAYLVLIAALPLLAGRFWESNRNKLVVAVAAGAPVALYLLAARVGGAALLAETARDYVAFMALLGALYVISGGIYLRGALAGTPMINTIVLAVGAVLASVIGTTGASALLIRPLLRANQDRPRSRHVVIFFIFIVANGGGLLTPLGDPPLFLGFLRGVPFSWTLRLAAPWALVNGALLAAFAVIDRAHRVKPDETRREVRSRQNGESEGRTEGNGAFARGEVVRLADGDGRAEPLRLEGALNLVWLLGVVATVFALGTYGRRWLDPVGRAWLQTAAMAGLAALSIATTPRRVHEANRFSWAPIHEVAVVFAGIFATMGPALAFLEERGAALGITAPWQFFWSSGALSSVLDNAPTYLTFASLATGVADGGRGELSVHDLGALAAHPVGQHLLAAVSCGSVLMGAMTYIGNGPNFMVKAIAEQHHVRMPSFAGYMAWSFALLAPLLGAVALVFF